jgi:hypothetical protein
MKKTILVLFGSALLAGSAIQSAAATEHHKAHKTVHAPAQMNERVRNSSAYWPAPQAQQDYSYYANRGLSAPAGR